MKKQIMMVFGVILISILLVIFAPFITILALNTLFTLGIPYSFGTWAAMIWVNLTILGGFKSISGVWVK